ncbi:MAG: hypothetical protein IJE09_04175 [Oscillospiraceae bacterium]|nr:hypothetical protein [Oscillospiraceae bacterium]
MKKTLMIMLALVLVIAMSVTGTLAYLTGFDAVTNTFTVGKVNITLDETDVDVYGVKDGNTRVKKNEYKLIPGREYVKDPVVHFQPNSEKSYLFIKVENGIKDIVSGVPIETQIANNNWEKHTEILDADGNVTAVVYYQVADASDKEVVDYKVFESFTIDGNAAVASYDGAQVNVTAYAVQFDGFENNRAGAWDAVKDLKPAEA